MGIDLLRRWYSNIPASRSRRVGINSTRDHKEALGTRLAGFNSKHQSYSSCVCSSQLYLCSPCLRDKWWFWLRKSDPVPAQAWVAYVPLPSFLPSPDLPTNKLLLPYLSLSQFFFPSCYFSSPTCWVSDFISWLVQQDRQGKLAQLWGGSFNFCIAGKTHWPSTSTSQWKTSIPIL